MIPKKRNPFNIENGEFRIKLNKFDTKRALAVMKFHGIPDRPAFLKMCVEAGIKKYEGK